MVYVEHLIYSHNENEIEEIITENEVKTKQPLFTKTFNQRAVEQQKSSGGSL